MNDAATATHTKENTMSETATEGTKTKKAKKAKPTNGLAKLAKLEKGPVRSVQETFRCTPEEHNKLVEDASAKGFTSMSDFYRHKLGLDK